MLQTIPIVKQKEQRGQPLPAARGSTLSHGIALMCAAVLLFTLSSTMVKALPQGFPLSEIVFFRCLPAFLPLLLVMRRTGGWSLLRTTRPGAHLFRVAVGGVALFLGFYTLTLMPLADYIAFTFAAPLFATLLSIPILGERVGVRRWSAVIAGFAGVLLMTQPGAQSLDTVTLLALATAFVIALATVAIRNLGRTEPSVATVFWFTLAGTLISGVMLPFEWRAPLLREWAFLLGIGLTSGIGQLLLAEAYRLAPPAVIAPFDYTALLWSMLLGLVFFGTFPEPIVLAGAALVVGSGIYIVFRETVRGVQPSAPVTRP
jgi:drug/metabolite transporter (DMT)-like permease